MPHSDTSPLISIIIRSMDRTTLQATLNSVAGQIHRPIEVVLVNAKGGTHRSEHDHIDTISIVLVNQGGLPFTRSQAANAGLDAAHGQYLAFLDDDDTIDPDHLSHLLSAIQTSGSQTIAYAGVRCVDRYDPEQKVSRIFGQPLENFAQLLAGNFIPIHAPLFPCQLRRQARYDETLETYEDWDFWLQLAQSTKFVYTHRVTATYFTGGSSGVSPQAPDWEAVRRASRALYAKWMRITPDEFRNICNLYHEAAANLKKSLEEIARFQLALEQSKNRIEQDSNLSNQGDPSSSGDLAWPIGQLKALIHQLLKR